MAKEVLIMRGLPGSGKTHWRKTNAPNAAVVSADDYHTVNGVYDFKPEKAREAHNTCLRRFVILTVPPIPHELVVVDNTNISPWEIAPYYRLAEAYGYQPRIINCICPLKVCKKRGLHGVPDSTYESMEHRYHYDWDTRPKWWKVEDVTTGTVEDLMELDESRKPCFTL